MASFLTYRVRGIPCIEAARRAGQHAVRSSCGIYQVKGPAADNICCRSHPKSNLPRSQRHHNAAGDPGKAVSVTTT